MLPEGAKALDGDILFGGGSSKGSQILGGRGGPRFLPSQFAGLFQLPGGEHLAADLFQGRDGDGQLLLDTEYHIALTDLLRLGDLLQLHLEGLFHEDGGFWKSFDDGGGVVQQGQGGLDWEVQTLGGSGKVPSVPYSFAQLFQTIFGPGGEAVLHHLVPQVFLHLFKGFSAPAFQLDEVDAEAGPHRLTDLANLQAHGPVLEGLHHGTRLEPSQTALVGVGGGVFTDRCGGLSEIAACGQFDAQFFSLLGGRREFRVGLGPE